MKDLPNLPPINESWRSALLQHAATVLAKGRDDDSIAYLLPDTNGQIDGVQEARYVDELPEQAIAVPLLCGPREARLYAVDWADVDPDTGEALGLPHIADVQLHAELIRYADRQWRAWCAARTRRQFTDDF